MKIRQPGVLENSRIYFHSASAQARDMFLYPLCTGYYDCSGGYRVDRQSYDSYLLLFVRAGNGYVSQDGITSPLAAGSLLLLDCYSPHSYYTDSKWEIFWVHFDGALARKYYEAITARGIVLTPPNPYPAERGLCKIYNAFHQGTAVNETLLSKYIYDLLTELLLFSSGSASDRGQASLIEDAVAYIAKHLDQPITLEQMARRVSLSPFYFTRLFKKETGYTPHAYLVQARVNLAKYYLKTTPLSVKEVGLRSGFPSESAFCSTFRKAVGLTPGGYRVESVSLSEAPRIP